MFSTVLHESKGCLEALGKLRIPLAAAMDCTPCRPRAVLANEVYEDIKLGMIASVSNFFLWSAYAILVPVTDDLSLFLFFAVDMFAVSVCERKKISSLMRFSINYVMLASSNCLLNRELGDLYPLSGFGHLKRVRTAGKVVVR